MSICKLTIWLVTFVYTCLHKLTKLNQNKSYQLKARGCVNAPITIKHSPKSTSTPLSNVNLRKLVYNAYLTSLYQQRN